MARKSGRQFQNEVPHRGCPSPWRVLHWMLTRRPPGATFTGLEPVSFEEVPPVHKNIRVTFIGHCTLLIEMAGLRILTDPVFSQRASPLPFMGPKRFHPPGILLKDLPPIDVVVVSHNHYDHLDAAAVKELGSAPLYIVPLGLGSWLRSRGISKVRELDWWQEECVGPLKVTSLPCQHWSKRTPFDARRSLWCGFAFEAEELKCLFIGDSGYYEGFETIGQRLGPFHVTALPIGGYEPQSIMGDVHMTPEEAVQAFEDVQGGILVPIHYGCFPLTDEEPAEPPRRLYNTWRERGHDVDHLWLLGPGMSRDLEHMVYIPTVQPMGKRLTPDATTPVAAREETCTEWGIAVCPYKGDMVDLEVVGARANVFEGDEGRSLILDHVRCSAYGDVEECQAHTCPLRDPAFLRGYELHGIVTEAHCFETFVEIDHPPEPRWWQEKLRLARMSGKQGGR